MATEGKTSFRIDPRGDGGAIDAPPAYFLSLTVENFRCFGRKQVLDLSNRDGQPAPWTIILGDNGTGKTTLLQCLAMLQPTAKSGMGYFPMMVDFMSISFFQNAWRRDKSGFTVRGSYVTGSKLREERWHGDLDDLVIQGEPTGWGADRANDNSRGLVCYGYGANRQMGKGALSERRTFSTVAGLFSDDAELLNAEEWLLQADYAASKAAEGENRASERRDRVEEVLISLLPDVTGLRFDPSPESIIGPHVEAETPYGWVPMQSLSLGYRTLIAWMVDLASRLIDRYPNSENPLAEPAVVLVDEIDLHLHPRWQRTLMSFLSDLFPNTQFIATAHSPLVVQSATNANIVVLRREGDHVVIDNTPAMVRNWRVDQILTSELFGLDSARPPYLDKLLAERESILGKSKLTDRDEKRLQEIGAEIGDFPTGETPADIEAMDIIRLAAARLKQLDGDVG